MARYNNLMLIAIFILLVVLNLGRVVQIAHVAVMCLWALRYVFALPVFGMLLHLMGVM